MHKKIMIVNVSPNMLEGSEKEINTQLAAGYESHGSPVVIKGELFYTLIHPGEKEYIKGGTAYPTEKQTGYIRWAYDVDEAEVADLRINKSEISKLISQHKEEGNGEQSTAKMLKVKLELIRCTGSPAPRPAPEEDPFNSDIPF